MSVQASERLDPKREDPVARARALQPLIAARADAIDAARELPPDLVEALHDAKLYRALLPHWLDGDEADLPTFSTFLETIAQADASTAWCIGQSSGCAMSAAYLEPAAAREIFGPRDGVVAWGAGPQGKAVPVDGGYRLSGRWMFASGSRHATWLGGHSQVIVDGEPLREASGEVAERTLFFPRSAAKIIDNWQVMGLRGTGSDSYEVEDLFVPERLFIGRDHSDFRRETGALYRFYMTQAYAAGFSGVALGIARAMLDPLIALARDKTPRAASSSLRDSPVFQSLIARAEAQLGAARAYLHETLRRIWDEVAASGELTLQHRIDLRLATTHAINEATEVSNIAYRAAGSTAIFEDQPFERRFRDAHAVSQQLQGRATHYETVGRHMLGLEPDSYVSI